MSSVNAVARRTCEVHGFDVTRDTPEARRTFSRSESEYWLSRAARYLDVAVMVVLAAVIVLLLVCMFPLPFPLAVSVVVCCVSSAVGVGVWCRRNYVAAMDFAVWSLEAGHEA